LIGPAVAAIAWIAGSYYGADAEQVIHKSPDATYAAVAQALDGMQQTGTTQFEGGKPTAYEVKIDREADRHLRLQVMFAGREGGGTDIAFEPLNGGTETLVKAKAHGNWQVLGEALSGSKYGRLAYAPDWMLNLLAVRPLLRQVGEAIEQGAPLTMPGQTQAEWESSLSQDDQRKLQDWRQYEASKPMIDPDADASRYMNGSTN
jgi:hypothetical protein